MRDIEKKFNQKKYLEILDDYESRKVKVTKSAAVLIAYSYLYANKLNIKELSALAKDFDDSKIYSVLAVAQHRSGDTNSAEYSLRKAISIEPNYLEAYHNLSILLGNQGKWTEAYEFSKKACSDGIMNRLYLMQYGRAAVFARKAEDAITTYKKILDINPHDLDAMAGLGAGYLLNDELTKAVDTLEQVVDKGNVEQKSLAMGNLAVTYKSLGKYVEAEKTLEEAALLDQGNIEHKWNLSLTKLILGKKEDGWRLYEWRYHPDRKASDAVKAPPINLPMLQKGEEVKGKSIILVGEQGYGDNIQFIRYAKLLKELGALQISLVVAADVAPLLRGVPWLDYVSTNWKALPQSDRWLYIMSCPHYFGYQYGESFSENYIFPDVKSLEKISTLRFSEEKLNVGCVWYGRATHTNDKNRSINFDVFKKVFNTEGLNFYSLQYGHKLTENQTNLVDLSDHIKTFADTAAILSQLDVLLTIDSAPAHMAAAMGIPVVLLLPFNPDFRWGLRDDTSPWYPHSLKIFRQTKRGDWGDVLDRAINYISLLKKRDSAPKVVEFIDVDPKNKLLTAGSRAITECAFDYHKRGDLSKALNLYELSISNQYDRDAIRNKAVILRAQGKVNEALDFYASNFHKMQDDLVFMGNYVNLLVASENWVSANDVANCLLEKNPNHAQNIYNLAVINRALDNGEVAFQFAERAVGLEPTNNMYLTMLGNEFIRKGNVLKAQHYASQSRLIQPRHYENILLEAQICFDNEDFEAAIKFYDEAISLFPERSVAYLNRAVSLSKLNRFYEAIDSCEKAISIKSNYGDAHFNMSLYLLVTGQFKRGWEEYSWRFDDSRGPKNASQKPKLSMPEWAGQDLKDKKIVIWPEQGFGDYIQFIRYAKYLKDAGASVVAVVRDSLKKIFSTCPYIDEIKTEGEKIENYNFWIQPLSLPKFFGNNFSILKKQIPYFSIDQSDVDFFRSKLSDNKKNIGIIWSGNPDHSNDRLRSVNKELLMDLVANQDINFVSLQHGAIDEKIIIGDREILNLSPNINSFYDLGASLKALDALVTIDSAPAHLAGALNVKTHVLLPFSPDWRWGLDVKESVWYSSLVLHRQNQHSNWDSSIKSCIKSIGESC